MKSVYPVKPAICCGHIKQRRERSGVSGIDYQALREAAVAIETVATPQKLQAFRMKVTPSVVLALLDEIKRLEDTNIDAMCRIAELEARKSSYRMATNPVWATQ